MHIFVVYPLFSGARKATKESVVISFCRKQTPSCRIQVGQTFFFSVMGCCRWSYLSEGLNPAESYVSLLCLWTLLLESGEVSMLKAQPGLTQSCSSPMWDLAFSLKPACGSAGNQPQATACHRNQAGALCHLMHKEGYREKKLSISLKNVMKLHFHIASETLSGNSW